MRGNNNPDANGDFPGNTDKTISCATIKGDYYKADFHQVNQ